MYNILVVDDDKEIVSAIEIYLTKEGYNVLKAYNGMEALKIVKENDDIHLILLDIMMPKLDGISTANLIRKDKKVPIIMLSAKSEDYDKITGLNNGADDYITKPFNPLELIARVNSQIRRYTSLGSIADKMEKGNNIYHSGDLIINDNTKQVEVEGKEIKIYLIKNPTGACEVLRNLKNAKNTKLMIAINDKYADGRDVSWLWDADFEILQKFNNRIFITGSRADDMALRLKYAGVNLGLMVIDNNIKKTLNCALESVENDEKLVILPTYTALLKLDKIIRSKA